MSYNFKTIITIPNSKDLINIILSKTQRKTPTEVHPNFKITRIRSFYLRKVKFTQDQIHEKLTGIIDQFPKLEDIHPFFADLINVLYDKDHYKLALGHIHSCRNIIDNVAKDYIRLLKYGDSLYRCKMLKRAALGRMCTLLKKLQSSLAYLEEVRKHLARLPQINPFERTLLITGYPNVGKSSFVNNITNAQVEVQPYPFTTQTLYVGHTDYNYVRWQVIDSPGILDHPLEQRNTIEMQSITALAHLKACILFFIDVSAMCGYTITQQVKLFESIRPLFKNKPVLIVLTKIDLKPYENIDEEEKKLLEKLATEENLQIVRMSNISGEGIPDVKTKACELLQDYRQKQNQDTLTAGNQIIKKEEQFLTGLYIAKPTKISTDIERPPVIPEAILKGEKVNLNRPTLKEMQEQLGGAGVFSFPLQEHFILEKEEWKYDQIPEIMDGKNIADFVDKDILEKLEELEKDEEMRQQAKLNNDDVDEEYEEDNPEFVQAKKEITSKRAILRLKHKLKQNTRVHLYKPKLEETKQALQEKGVESQELENRVKAKNLKRKKKLNDLEMEIEEDLVNKEDGNDDQIQDEDQQQKQQIEKKVKEKRKSMSRSRSKGFKIVKTSQEQAMERLKFKIDKKWAGKGGRAGEADRTIPSKMPKHLFSGKRKQGSHDRR